jgi:hypothetical protein
MEIQQTSFKVKTLIRYSIYRNYLLRYMCINFLGNGPQADGEWQKLHSHAYTQLQWKACCCPLGERYRPLPVVWSTQA